jgi:hypothetical protein
MNGTETTNHRRPRPAAHHERETTIMVIMTWRDQERECGAPRWVADVCEDEESEAIATFCWYATEAEARRAAEQEYPDAT